MKTCFKCGNSKPLSSFYRHPQMADGYLGKCKTCARSDAKVHRLGRIESYHGYDKRRAKDPKRKAAQLQYQRKMRANNPHKAKAWYSVAIAIKKGVLIRRPCEVCGATKTHAHHDDYRKPLDVRWLCFRHHREVAHGQIVTSPFEGPG